MTGTSVVAIAHAALGASSAKRWMNCPGSLRMIEALPPERRNVETKYAAEGSAAHKIASTCLEQNEDASDHIGEVVKVGVFEFTVDEAMVDAIQLYLDTVRNTYRPEEGDILFVEKQFSLAALDPPRPMFGTTDCAVFKPRSGKLVVIDFKYGAGVTVDATDNDQGRYYGVGACIELSNYPVTEIEVVIVQPRAPHAQGPVRRETVSAFDLLEWSAVLLERAHETIKPDAPLRAGDWCRFCPARDVCPELRRHSAEICRAEFDSDLELNTVNVPSPNDLTPEEVGRVVLQGKILLDWYRAVCARGYDMVSHGVPGTGLKLVAGRGRRKWNNENDEEIAGRLMLDFGLEEDQIFERVLRSPAQMEPFIKRDGEVLAKDRRTQMNATLVTKKPGKATLVPADDPRPAIDASLALEFSDDTDEEN